MIKVEKNHKCQSYWRTDGLYDDKREKTTEVKVFGITIWHKKDSYDCDLVEHKNENGIGFKK